MTEVCAGGDTAELKIACVAEGSPSRCDFWCCDRSLHADIASEQRFFSSSQDNASAKAGGGMRYAWLTGDTDFAANALSDG